jgi:2'-5' RNA ligase
VKLPAFSKQRSKAVNFCWENRNLPYRIRIGGPAVRAFIAFALPPEIEQHARVLQERFRAAGLKLRWVATSNIHLTIRFLGEIDPSMIDPIGAAIQASARSAAPIDLVVQGLGVFPNIRRPNVLWAGLGGQLDNLQQLHARLEDELAFWGFAREKRPFRAHLTLARIKDRIDSRNLSEALKESGNFEPLMFTATELILFRSDLRPQGAQYTQLVKKKLGGVHPEVHYPG